MSSGVIRIRGARQHNLKNLDLDIRTGEMTVVTGPSGSGKSQPGLRHAVCRRPAALRRDLQRLCAPVPRPHGPPGGRPRRRRAAGDRDRPDQPGAQLAQHGRHDDRAERPPEAAVSRARRSCSTAQTAQPVRHDTPETIYAELLARTAARATRGWWSPFRSSCRPTPRAEQQEQWLAASGFTRVQAEREVRRRPGRASCSTWWPTASASQGTEKVRAIEAIELALKRGSGRVNVYVGSDEQGAPALALLAPACTAPRATCATPTRSRRCSASTRPSAPARPAAASAA